MQMNAHVDCINPISISETQRMMIKRFASYLGMALAMCLGSFTAHAEERIEYIVAATYDIGYYGAEGVKHELTLSQWRQESQTGSDTPASNLIALSNHFGMTSAAPFSVPDWDAATNA